MKEKATSYHVSTRNPNSRNRFWVVSLTFANGSKENYNAFSRIRVEEIKKENGF